LPTSGGGDDGEEGLAVAVELAAAHPGNDCQTRKIARPAPHHLQERRVVKDDVGRHALLAGELQSTRAQRGKERLVARRGRSIEERGRDAASPSALRFRLDRVAA